MKPYEGVFIFPPESAPEERKTQLKSLDDLIAKFHGEIVQKMEWGKRPLGYAIRKFREGHFLIVDFKMSPSGMAEFRKNLDLQDSLLKYMVTVKDTKVDKKAAAKPPQEVPAKSHRPSSPAAAPTSA